MAPGHLKHWIAVLGLTLLSWKSFGSMIEADTSVEVRFAGTVRTRWRLTESAADRIAPNQQPWIRAESALGTRSALLGDRVVLRVHPGTPFPAAAATRAGLERVRTVGPDLWILQGRNPWAALRAAASLSREPGVVAAAPVMRGTLGLHGRFAARPLDPYFTNQWHLENRRADGSPIGPDTNPREAWTLSQGAGVTIGICDDGFEVNHPDLKDAADGAPHYDFARDRPAPATYGSHSTSVAGLAAARGNNGIGVTGLAPLANLASLAIFDGTGNIVSDERRMDMFQHEIDVIGVQNHSWGNADVTLSFASEIEKAAISNAVTNGRGGLGVVMVRSGGNGRESANDVNDDAYPSDPNVIAVAAVRRDGRAASYSNPGACLLVGAPSGDSIDTFEPSDNLFTTDRVGSRGYNQNTGSGDLANYAFDETGFSGTSASAPEISGVVALILSANPTLAVRDVQQILIHASRQFDLTDPFVVTNAAGYVVSHNQGFGIPDAGLAVRLARSWSNRPPVVTASVLSSPEVAVADDGLKVWITEGSGEERSVRCFPALGPHADDPTQKLPLVFVGRATATLTNDLVGKAALIERGTNFFRDKIQFAAQAGARFAVIFNHIDADQLMTPAGTDFDAIPSVLITENEGRALVDALASGTEIQAQLRIDSTSVAFVVTNAIACEHIGLRVRSDHTRRGDLRITLRSPSGTQSILQRRNNDTEAGPEDWTYWSVQHFGEPAAGTWTARFADELQDETGSILEVELLVRGITQEDVDQDGLDDRWENQHFQSLSQTAGSDPDRDGRSNAAEQILGSSPLSPATTLQIDASAFSETVLRLAWPADPYTEYSLLGGTHEGGVSNVVTQVAGRLSTAEAFVPIEPGGSRLFQLQANPR